jgi:hypothetical protein
MHQACVCMTHRCTRRVYRTCIAHRAQLTAFLSVVLLVLDAHHHVAVVFDQLRHAALEQDARPLTARLLRDLLLMKNNTSIG